MNAVTGRVAAAERGETRIADRVVAKIAAQAAREAVEEPARNAAPPSATVTVHRDAARVRVTLELGYPCDIGRSCGAVRSRVADRVRAWAGMDVPEVAVRVEKLHPAAPGSAGQGRTR
ncbi:hypothetical protein [uncultured Streptomyces sp.]|uniref:hypothetical protein n=1 Tax=uncultured Streptomyces sp. TaxID=174707 RepID=UPI00260A3664|nr:hypothetical protein [uncultured Streptomyces sp.]